MFDLLYGEHFDSLMRCWTQATPVDYVRITLAVVLAGWLAIRLRGD